MPLTLVRAELLVARLVQFLCTHCLVLDLLDSECSDVPKQPTHKHVLD